MRADEKRDEIEHKANTIENASTNLGGYVNSLSSHGRVDDDVKTKSLQVNPQIPCRPEKHHVV